ncbi:MAG: nitrate- and nitrite sensing domain-containing protein [Fulvimarina manganoxydans]|nr:nitrate- and nitrite sensing domain-containing protein [Fulvimarina manganoxydans]MCK5931292.1 nitrate- and nitrite sensing domain-containing protein [Fulvimarina manganoxydans]
MADETYSEFIEIQERKVLLPCTVPNDGGAGLAAGFRHSAQGVSSGLITMRFDQISIRSRLLFCVVLPLASSLLLGLLWLNIYVGRHDQMEELVARTQSMRLASDLIDGLQAERGTTAGFIGSKGQKMVSEMAAARETSDGAIARFVASKTAHGADLDVRHAQIEAVIGEIGDIRSQIDALTLPGGEAFPILPMRSR